MSRFISLLFGLSIIAGILPPVELQSQPDCAATTGNVIREDYYSSLLEQRMYYTVYTPPCYDETDMIYPAVYLMHGSNENDEHWIRLGMVEILDTAIVQGELPPMLVMMPFGNVIANRNRFDAISWGNIFMTEMLPDAENLYRVDPAKRAIGGVSRGGFWAYSIGLRHPEIFRAIGGHSAFFDRYHAPEDFNPLDLILTAPGAITQALWLDRGIDDYAFEGLDIMHERMNQRGLEHTYEIYPEGQHNNSYWSQHVRTYLDFYASSFETDPTTAQSPAPTATLAATQGVSGFVTNTPANNPSPVTTPAPMLATTTPQSNTSGGFLLFVPTVAFPSLQTTISSTQINSVADGTYDASLVLTATTQAKMLAAGLSISPQTRIIADDDLRSTLWRERRLYTLLPFDALTPQYRMLWIDDVPLVDRLENYPFAIRSTTPNFDPAKLTRVTLSGVTALTRQTRDALLANGLESAANGIRDYVTRSDYFHMSNEVSFISGCPNAGTERLGGSSSFCSLPEHFRLFDLLETDIIELTGNHNNDYGYGPYRDTFRFFRDLSIQTIGGGLTVADSQQPLILEHNGNQIGMLACNDAGPYYALANEDKNALGGIRPGAAACDFNWLENALPDLADETDIVIMTVQHKEFEEYLPTDEQRFRSYRMANLGADVVMGTAAHKPQTYDFPGTDRGTTAFIHYGMGNLYFDQPFWGNSRFFMNTLYIYDGQLQTVEVFPGIIDELYRPRLMTPEERENFLFFMFVEQNRF